MKTFKNIIINLICIALLCVATDFIICAKRIRNIEEKVTTFKYICDYYATHYRNYSEKELENKYILDSEYIYRPVENKNSKLPPILIFSDSFLYGYLINNYSDTYTSLLGQMTKRPIYNRGAFLMSCSHMLFQLKNEKFYKIVPKPKDIIFSLKENNITTDTYGITPWMNLKFCYKKDKNGNLVFYKYSFFENILSIKILSFADAFKTYTKETEDLFLANMKECKKEVEKHWGKDVNFYIIVAFSKSSRYAHTLKELENLGFRIIYLDDKFFNDENNYIEYNEGHLSEIGNKKLAEYTYSFIENN